MKRITVLIAMTLVAMALAPSARADEFEGMPGLWKTTLSSGQGEKDPTYIQWHCVDEGADPWGCVRAVAHSPARGVHAKRLRTNGYVAQVASGLHWRLQRLESRLPGFR